MSENRFSSESLIEEGAVVRNRQELIKLPDTSRMKVTIKVHESHVGLVQPGQPAFVKLDSMPDQRFQGVVEKVALLPDSQSRFGNPNLKVYNTEVVITDPLAGVKPGVSAQAEIIITNISNALSVPLQAVTSLKGRQVVYVAQGGKTVPIPSRWACSIPNSSRSPPALKKAIASCSLHRSTPKRKTWKAPFWPPTRKPRPPPTRPRRRPPS